MHPGMVLAQAQTPQVPWDCLGSGPDPPWGCKRQGLSSIPHFPIKNGRWATRCPHVAQLSHHSHHMAPCLRLPRGELNLCTHPRPRRSIPVRAPAQLTTLTCYTCYCVVILKRRQTVEVSRAGARTGLQLLGHGDMQRFNSSSLANGLNPVIAWSSPPVDCFVLARDAHFPRQPSSFRRSSSRSSVGLRLRLSYLLDSHLPASVFVYSDVHGPVRPGHHIPNSPRHPRIRLT